MLLICAQVQVTRHYLGTYMCNMALLLFTYLQRLNLEKEPPLTLKVNLIVCCWSSNLVFPLIQLQVFRDKVSLFLKPDRYLNSLGHAYNCLDGIEFLEVHSNLDIVNESVRAFLFTISNNSLYRGSLYRGLSVSRKIC